MATLSQMTQIFSDYQEIRDELLEKLKAQKEFREAEGDPLKPFESALSLVRKYLPLMIANDIIGVQPMYGLVGEVFEIRVKYEGKIPKLSFKHHIEVIEAATTPVALKRDDEIINAPQLEHRKRYGI